MNCQRCKNELAILLLDAENPAAAALQAHVDGCESCAAELCSLQATMAAMDEWAAPEPSPFFDTRLHARLREEMAAEPAGLWERMRARLLFNTSMQMRQVTVGAMALVILAGGGGYAGFSMLHPKPVEVSNTVQELQVLDRNDQTIQQMDQLLDDGSSNTTTDQGTDTQQNP